MFKGRIQNHTKKCTISLVILPVIYLSSLSSKFCFPYMLCNNRFLKHCSFKVSTMLTFIVRGRWRSIAVKKGSAIVSWCCKVCGQCGWSHPVELCHSHSFQSAWIHPDLAVSARTDDNLPMALSGETDLLLAQRLSASTRTLTL